MTKEEEFLMSLTIYGGIILAGILISIAVFGIALNKNFFKRKETIKREIYEQKERKNGQAKKT